MISSASTTLESHDSGALLAILICGTAALFGLGVYLLSSFTRSRRTAYTPATVCRDVAISFCTGALTLYLWGCAQILLTSLDDQYKFEECEKAGGFERAKQVDAYVGGYIPLRFTCHMPKGAPGFDAVVPGYLNPSMAALLLAALAVGGASVILRTRQRRRSTSPQGEGKPL
ncbi:hypothetical protein [Streptomyces sp. NPDC017940]|uniref:hypothetical protein n=1 Tax=Streptomyces sp. NPDC017940 TaxID=3365017 RepID=UPI003799E22B